MKLQQYLKESNDYVDFSPAEHKMFKQYDQKFERIGIEMRDFNDWFVQFYHPHYYGPDETDDDDYTEIYKVVYQKDKTKLVYKVRAFSNFDGEQYEDTYKGKRGWISQPFENEDLKQLKQILDSLLQ